MRLNTLRLRAIGPFVDEQVIDFGRLGAGGLFLLEGPTGAGKTTVLDAVTFALYGSVTGAASDARRLASDFAAPGTAPEVQLELAVRGRRLRMTRTPEHERPKVRGEGIIKERPTAHLEEWQDGGWVSLAHRQDEIGSIVGDLLGLTREQFRQVVLLPQGEFATFLRADDDGRRTVLVKLFGTQFYERLTGVLQARASVVRAKVRDSESDLEARINAAWEASGRRPEDDPEHPLTWEQQVADLTSVTSQMQRQAVLAHRISVEAGGAEVAARLVAREAQDVVARVDERDGLLAEVAALEAQRTGHEQRVSRLRSARQARPVRPLLELLDTARTRVGDTLAALTQLGLDDAAGDPATRSAQLVEQAATSERTVASLGHVVKREATLPGTEADLDAAVHRVSQESAEVERLRATRDALPARLAEVTEQAQAARAQVSAGELAVRERARAERRRRAAAEVAELQARIDILREQERAARRTHDEARDYVAVVVELRLAGLQSELAARLVSGDPCLVCGSLEHPAPAAAERSGVSEEHLEEAGRARDEAWAAWESLSGSLKTAEARQVASMAVADGLDVAGADELLTGLAAIEAAGTSAQSELARLVGEEKRLRAAETAVQKELLAATTVLATAKAQVQALRNALEKARVEVAAELGSHETVAARCAALQASAIIARTGAVALTEHAQAQAHAQSALRGALAAAQASGFADLDEAEHCALEDEALATLEGSVREWERGLESASDRLAGEHLAAVAGLAMPLALSVCTAADALLVEATGRARSRADQATRCQHTADLLDRLLVGVREAAERRAVLAESADELSTVDDYVRGHAGSPRMTLSTFVLRYWFEQVVAAANVRLSAMSSGKYELLRVERGARAASRVGLGLAILDRHTGRERGTETLSGGESFYTSLSLALGLADVVVAQAGGAQLDTLFIDEGFGSLDKDTLDEVMTVIDELRGHGRVVGVVSHVAELNERIPERLSIRRVRADGPSTITLVA